jgi:ferredoxin
MDGVTVLEREDLDGLLAALAGEGYTIVGPTVREGAIVYDEVRESGDLPVGWTDEQDGGSYRLRRREDEAVFGYAVGPHSWKRYQLPPEVTLWRGRRRADGALAEIEQPPREAGRLAFLGARSCELHAMDVLDRVLGGPPGRERSGGAAAAEVFVVAVNCGQAGGTCFCASMGTGPVAESGFDLALTEVLEEDRHYFVVEIGSERGGELLAQVPHSAAGERQRAAATGVQRRTAGEMGRELDVTDIRDLLYRNYEHPRWEEVAERCLSCGNCTMVCPTCFCTSVEDTTDLSGEVVERRQSWDSCFTVDYSHLSGGSVRSSARSRYRQWMTHKLATWFDQFGSSGCVGCGRCITWCPVGIDITEEAAAIRAGDGERDADD